MASGLINLLIENYLGDIFEIDKEKTNLAILNGSLELENIKIKQQFIDKINIPFVDISAAFIGNLKLTIRLPLIWRHPINVKIDKIFFHFKQKHLEKIEEKEIYQQLEQLKIAKLRIVDELYRHLEEIKQQDPGPINFIKLFLQNIYIEISDVFFYFENTDTNCSNPFVVGFGLKQIVLETIDKKEFGKEFVSDDIVCKNFMLKGLSIFQEYLNQQLDNYFIKRIRTDLPTMDLNNLDPALQ